MDELLSRLQNAFDESEVNISAMKREFSKVEKSFNEICDASLEKLSDNKPKRLCPTGHIGVNRTPNFSDSIVQKNIRKFEKENLKVFEKRVPRRVQGGTPKSSRSRDKFASPAASRTKKLVDITNTKKNESMDELEVAFKLPTRPMPALKAIKYLTFDNLDANDEEENAPAFKHPPWSAPSKLRRHARKHQNYITPESEHHKFREIPQILITQTFQYATLSSPADRLTLMKSHRNFSRQQLRRNSCGIARRYGKTNKLSFVVIKMQVDC
jgi:hypothetical protein